jgi:hypothetical protein
LAGVVVDDHLLRDILAGRRQHDLDGLAADGVATTGLWLFRLCSSLADPEVLGKLSAPVASLPTELQAVFTAQLLDLPEEIEVVSLRALAWPMAQLQARHRAEGRLLSAAMTEALAAAHHLDAGLAAAAADVGPNLQAAAEADGIAFHVL